ncbi:MAG: hypothetical protein U9Q88_02730 [Bacillota bacterium]|nr:hypothetical protein [Bacillota bacterium]
MEHRKSAIELMMDGFAKLEESKLEDGKQTEAEKQGDVTNFKGEKQERELSSIEKLMQGYKPKEGGADNEEE